GHADSAQAANHSSWHWEAEQPLSSVRRAIRGQVFGHITDDTLSHEEQCAKITNIGTRQLIDTMTAYAQQYDKRWHVTARSPKVGPEHVLGGELIHEYYQAQSRKSFVFRMCCGKNKCDTCLASIASRQRRDPDWTPEDVLESLRENGYDMYWPGEIPEEAPQEGPLGPLTVVADERDPGPAEEQRSYPTFLDMCLRTQKEITIPINSNKKE
ncbi:unnamed protein product, partial [Prorocentrum cordatum]